MKDENTSPSQGLEGNLNFQQANGTKSDWVGDSDSSEVFHTSYLSLQINPFLVPKPAYTQAVHFYCQNLLL
jgi:hypothetical protein